MKNILVLDSRIGAGAMAAVDGAAEYLFHSSHVTNSTFYGTTVIPDCPDAAKQCT
jgi:hypothetical protein